MAVNVMDIYNQVQQAGQQGVQQGQQSRLQGLYQQYMNGPDDQRDAVMGQIASLNPQAGENIQKLWQGREDMRNTTRGKIAAGFLGAQKSFPAEAMQSLWDTQFVPAAKRQGIALDPYDANTTPGLMQSWAGMYGPNAAAGTPTGTREFEAMAKAAGYEPGSEGYQNAARVNLGTMGRASSAGYSQVKFTGSDGRERIGTLNGKTGQIDMADGTSFNPQTGQITQTQPYGSVQAPPGVYIDPSLPPEVQAKIANAEAAGQPVPSQMYFGGGGASPFVGRTPEDQAGRTTNAQEAAKFPYTMEEIDARTQAAIKQALAEAEGKAKIEADAKASAKTAQRANDDRESLLLLNEASKLLKTATSGGAEEMWKGANRYIGRTTEGAKSDAQLNIVAGKLLGKVPRFEGPQSNTDVQIYQQMAGDLANPNKTREERIAAAKGMMNLIAQYQDYAKPKASTQPSTGATPKVRRYNPATGRLE